MTNEVLIGILIGALIILLLDAIIILVPIIKRRFRRDIHINPLMCLYEYTNDIVDIAKIEAEHLMLESDDIVKIKVKDSIDLKILTDNTTRVFFSDIEFDPIILRAGDSEIHQAIKNIIIENFNIIIEHWEEKVKQIEKLERTDITKNDKPKIIETWTEDKNNSITNALNSFYSDDDTYNV